MGVKWTAEQIEAIKARDCNLLVAAAAGSGKTAVLVERIIDRILEDKNPVDIDRLLIVTFTNAAAEEMKNRIGDAILERMDKLSEKVEPEKYQWLKRQLVLLNKASITTIHSFCQNIVKTYYHKINIDPSFTVADETQVEIIKAEILDELLDELYEKETENKLFADLVECFGGSRSDEGLKETILSVYRFINGCPFPEKWLTDNIEKFNRNNYTEGIDFSQTVWGRLILENFQFALDNFILRIKKAMDLCEGNEYAGYYSTLYLDINSLESLKHAVNMSWDETYKALSGFEFSGLGRAGKNADKSILEAVKNIRNKVKDDFNKYRTDIININSHEAFNDLNEMYPLLSMLASIILDFDRRYKEYKRSRALIDFNDMEHYALDILAEVGENGSISPTEAALNYREYFEEIYTDEYQDSNMTQELILSLISRNGEKYGNRFMVGDVKQSIYGFRNARPDIFLEKYEKYSEAKDATDRLIKLYKNFRSREDIIGSVNYIFSRIMSRNAGEMDYNRSEYLFYGADYPKSPSDTSSELLLGEYIKKTDRSDYEDIELPVKEQFEAMMAAQKIKELISGDINSENGGRPFQVYDRKRGTFRDIRYSDIVVLMRSTRNNAEIYQEVFISQGIPVYWDAGVGFFLTREVQVILSLLRIIDNPCQDIPLLAVMLSPIGGFSDEDLIDIRLYDKKNLFYINLKKICRDQDFDQNLREKIARFIDNLEKWRSYASEMTTSELISLLYDETGYYDMVGVLPDGDKQKANLRLLYEHALQYEKNGSVGIFNFLGYIDKVRASGDLGSATVLGENDNVVRIMSIHKSKGLEFPVVFLCGCGKEFNTTDQKKKIIYHQDLGLGPDYIDPELRIIYHTKAKRAIMLKQSYEIIAEEMRLLYVAMTRAREKLIISGVITGLSEKLQEMYERVQEGKMTTYDALRAKCYLDWILPVLLRHPDMAELRKIAGLDVRDGGLVMPEQNEESSWKLTYKTIFDILDKSVINDEVFSVEEGDTNDNSVKTPFEQLAAGEFDADWIGKEIEKRLKWKYPFDKLTQMPVKLTVSELKRLKETEEDGERLYTYIPSLVKKPSFLTGKTPPAAAQKGSATHFVLQNLNLDKIRMVIENFSETCKDHRADNLKKQLILLIEEEINLLQKMKMISEEEASWVEPGPMAAFFMSHLGRRMLKSPQVKREVPFTMELDAAKIYEKCDKNLSEKITIQGIIDCYFLEDGGYVILDYKTDRVSRENMAEAAGKYEIQIKTYMQAVEKGTGKKVKESYIYFLSAGDCIRLDDNEIRLDGNEK